MTRVSWGRAFAFGAVAIGAPWAVVSVIAAALWLLEGDNDAFVRFILQISPANAAGAAVIAALLTRVWPPLNRVGAAMHGFLACIVAIAVTGVVMAAFTAERGLNFFALFAIFGGGIFLLCGGTPWVLAGGVLASRILPTARVTRPRWAPAAWILVGIVAVVVAVVLMVPYAPEQIYFAQPRPIREPVPGPWHWFPLGRGVGESGGPSWIPTFILANGLGIVALGAALWATREPDPGSAPVSSLGSADPAGS